MDKIISIIGARPQFIKHAPMQLQLQKYFNALTIHTGQHYDSNMSDIFFNELNIAAPDFLFDIGGSKAQGEQTAVMMIEIEKVFLKENPKAVIIYGDTNSTLAGTIVAAKMNIPIIHIEAGLRSFNRTMPEEINRIVADSFSMMLFCPSRTAIENLSAEGITHKNIFLTGDVMCDMIHLVKDKTKRLINEPYYFATIHRPYNTDSIERLLYVIDSLNKLDKKVVFPIHPRTISKLKTNNINLKEYNNLICIDPVGYIDSISYQLHADCVLTDSGGIQKEAYIMKKKCITIRKETEWVETLQNGWNTLVFENLDGLQSIIKEELGAYEDNLFGDGNASVEIVEHIKKVLSNYNS